MRILLFIAVWLFSGIAYSAQPSTVELPITITAGTTTSNQFIVPKNLSGTLKVEIPCDPTWLLQIGVQTSIDKGATWDCDMVKTRCPGFSRLVGPCFGVNMIAFLPKGSPTDNALMRIITISNKGKTFTVTVTFDPS
jgi:hypothetical protein